MRARLRYRPKEVWVALTKLGTHRRMAHLWLSNTLPRSLGRAYQATKQMRNIHKHMPGGGVPFWHNPSQRAIISYVGTEIGISVSIVYCSVLSCRIIIYLLGISNKFGTASPPGMALSKLTEGGGTERVDRRLTRIGTTTKDSDNQRGTLLPPPAADPAGRVFHSVECQQGNGPEFVVHHDESAFTVAAPCSLATHRFRAGLGGRPSLGTLWASIQVAEYPKGEAYPMIIGPFLIACVVIPVSLLSRGLKPWIAHRWNTHQPGVPPGHGDELATGGPREVEELPRSYGVSSIPEGYRSRNQCLANMKYEGTMQLVGMRNEDSIQAIPNSSTGITYSVILSASLIPNEERPASTNMRAREFVRDLSDTVKAPPILLLTDPCIGFHPPHGRGIIIDTLSGHLGFVPNRYVIPRLVSTSPVISDTAFKHWIPRYPNRIPPPIAATHHATNE